jgi:hypothetical protein
LAPFSFNPWRGSTILLLIMSFYRKITSLIKESSTTISFSEAERALRLKQLQEEQGGFWYEEDGFCYPFKEGVEKISWAAIERIVAYKGGQLATDKICLDVFWKDWKWTITEDTLGWYIFVAKLKEVFPTIPGDWDNQIIQPPFASNYIVLYERGQFENLAGEKGGSE